MPYVRTRNLFDPKSDKPYKLSRARLELFLQCPRCFYLDRRLGVDRPSGPPFNLNKAVDKLLKKEFDIHRAKGTKHPLLKKYGIDAAPVHHEYLNIWRENFKGIQYHHKPTNLIVTGAIDDLWQNKNKEYIVVDYKATSKEEVIFELKARWQDQYKRQMEVYQWLLRNNGYKVAKAGYFVYCNGKTDRKAFDGKLEFDLTLIAHKGDDSWVEGAVKKAHACLVGDIIPKARGTCDFCAYREAVAGV